MRNLWTKFKTCVKRGEVNSAPCLVISANRESLFHHLRPLGLGLCRSEDGGDECDAFDAFLDAGGVNLRDGFSCNFGTERTERLAVEVGKGFDVPLGMSPRNARRLLGVVAQVAVTARVARDETCGVFDVQIVGVLLSPFETEIRSEDADFERVFFARLDLRRVENAFRAALVADEDVTVIFQLVAWDEGGDVRAERIDFKARDELHEVFAMRPQVTHAAGRSCDLGIHAPHGEIVGGCFDEP